MRRKIYDILKENDLVHQRKGTSVMHYTEEQDGNIVSKTYEFLSWYSQTREVEYPWVEKPLEHKSPAIGISRCLPKRMVELYKGNMVDETKLIVYLSILIRLVVDNKEPMSAVHVWAEEDDRFIYVKGVCVI